MALVTCPDCEARVSDLAPACLKCGRPMTAAPPPVRVAEVAPARVGSAGNILAALFSLLVPGLGQLLQGRIGAAFACFFGAGVVWIAALAANPVLVLLAIAFNPIASLEAAMWKGTESGPAAPVVRGSSSPFMDRMRYGDRKK